MEDSALSSLSRPLFIRFPLVNGSSACTRGVGFLGCGSPITAGIAVHSGQVAHGRKKAWGTAALALTSCLVQACSSSSAPMLQKASPRPCRMAQDYVGQNKVVIDSSPLCVCRDSTGHENRAFLAAGVGCRHA